MKLSLLFLPTVLGSMLVTGCVTGPGTYSSSGSSWDDSYARNQWEADAQNDNWINQQQAQASIDAGNAAAAAAAVATANP